MSKVKSPLLSLDAHGSVGDAITFKSSPKRKVAEKKPLLPYFLTLPVQYQRWLYEDYAYRWTQQTATVKRQYAASGVRHHLTSFQYWMKYHLTNLPDIISWYKLDDFPGAEARDSSRSPETATVFGASHAVGQIDGAFLFDGLNDYMLAPHKAGYNVGTGDFTIEFWFKFTSTAIMMLWQHRGGVNQAEIRINANNGRILAKTLDSAGNADEAFTPVGFCNTGYWRHLAFVRTQSELNLYIDYSNHYTGVRTPRNPDNAGAVLIGKLYAGAWWYGGSLDNIIFYDRALESELIRRHALRRYP